MEFGKIQDRMIHKLSSITSGIFTERSIIMTVSFKDLFDIIKDVMDRTRESQVSLALLQLQDWAFKTQSQYLKLQSAYEALKQQHSQLIKEHSEQKEKNSQLQHQIVRLKSQLSELQSELAIIKKQHEHDTEDNWGDIQPI